MPCNIVMVEALRCMQLQVVTNQASLPTRASVQGTVGLERLYGAKTPTYIYTH